MKAMWEKNGGKEKNQTKMWEKEGWKKRRKKSAGNEKKTIKKQRPRKSWTKNLSERERIKNWG